MKSNKRKYSEEELLNKVKSLPSYLYIPDDFWIIGVRYNRSEYSIFDDIFYIFKDDNMVDILTGTTQTGGFPQNKFEKLRKRGKAIIKSNEIYYDVWTRTNSSDTINILQQTGSFKTIRANDVDKYSSDTTEFSHNLEGGLNFRPNVDNLTNKTIDWLLDKESIGTQIVYDIDMYRKLIDKVYSQKLFTFCLLDEF